MDYQYVEEGGGT